MRANGKRLAVQRAVLETLESRRMLSLAAPASYAVGTNPQAVATGDLNNDGRSDVVTANISGNNVSVLLSNANGTLQAAQHFATAAGPRSVAVGDVNNDGKRDIVTANGGGHNLSVLLGNGNGTFQPAQSVTLPGQFPPNYTGTPALEQAPRSVAVGDLNADGKLDLVVNGQTTFYVPYISPYGGQWYWPQTNDYVNVLVGNGNGTFATANTYPWFHTLNSIGVADFNGDSKQDVMGGSYYPTVWLGNGNGTLQDPPLQSGFNAPTFAIGDFDMDGKADLVAMGGGLTFLKGLGNGTFQNPVTIPVVGQVRSAVSGDVNGDGKLDLVANTQQTTFEYYGYYGGYNPTTTEYTKVLLGYGDGTFSRGVSTTIGSHAGYGAPIASALGDFNGDTRPDLVATDPLNNKVFTQLNELGWVVPGTLLISDATAVTEGHTGTVNAVFTVTLDHAPAPAASVSVNYEVLDGTATLAGGDFVATSATLTFAPGQTSKMISVPVKGDRVGEYDENFVVRLTDATNADIIDRDGLGTISDDEPRIVSFTGGTVVEGNSGTVPLTFTVTLSSPSDLPVTVTYTTVDYYAVSATDFVPVTGTLTFEPGQTTRTFTVQVKGDLVAEYEEQLPVNLTGSTNSLIVITPQAFGTIIDTDPNPSISISNVSRAEGNSGLTMYEFVVSLSSLSEKEVWVRFTTGNGSAASSGGNKDYSPESGYVSIYARQVSASIGVQVIGDTRSESDETFVVNLSDPNNCTIADGQGVATIINDETRGKTWIGPASGGNWSTAANWSPIGVPTATSLIKIAGASVTLPSSASVSELDLGEGATLTMASGGNRVLRTPTLIMHYDATLNLGDNDLIVDYTAGSNPFGGWNAWHYNGMIGLLQSGYNLGGWDGRGIITTQPDALAGLTTLGIGEAADVLGLSSGQTGLFSGQTVDATTVLVKYTHMGDVDLNGHIDAADYGAIDNWVQFPVTSGYCNGDFNFDGIIDAADYGYIDNNIQMQGLAL